MEKINENNQINVNKITKEDKIRELLNNQKKLCDALMDLDEKFYKLNIVPFEVKIIDDFVLIDEPIVSINDRKKNISSSDEIKGIIKEVGDLYQLNNNWFSDDMTLANKSLKDLEWITGKLTFHEKMNMAIITVNVLDFIDILRMKIITLDSIISNSEDINEIEEIDNNNNNEVSFNNNINKNDNIPDEETVYNLLDQIVNLIDYEDIYIDKNNPYNDALYDYIKDFTVNTEEIYDTIINYNKY